MTDEAETPKLSPSIAHLMTCESPLHAWTAHRLLGGRPRKPTEGMEKGTIIHALVLGAGGEIEVVDADDFRKKEAREARDAAMAEGKIPVAAGRIQVYQDAASRIRENIAALGYDLDEGSAEQRLEWVESAESGDVVDCSGQADWIRHDHQLVIDLKTTEGSAHPNVVGMKLDREGGVLQDTAYTRAIEQHHPELAGRVEVIFLFAQTVEPYAVTPAYGSGMMKQLGAIRWERAVNLWAECMAKGRERRHWPAYADKPVRVDPPAWVMAREMEEQA